MFEPVEKLWDAAEDDAQDREKKSDCENTVRHDSESEEAKAGSPRPRLTCCRLKRRASRFRMRS